MTQIDLSGDGGVLKESLKEGTGKDQPSAGAKVCLHYTGTLTDGTVFDSSVGKAPFEFELGKDELILPDSLNAERVIKAFDMGVASMKMGEKCKLTCAPEYAYGKGGSPPSIPPDAVLIFELEMLDWKDEDISPDLDGSLERVILESSKSRRTPVEGLTVKIHMTGKYDGKVFDDREVEFCLGEGAENGVIFGVEFGLSRIAVGETSKLRIHGKHAFGEKGNSEFCIPPNATIEYIVKLIECERRTEEWRLSDEERVDQSAKYKEKGTTYFKKENYKLAIKMYKKCIDFLPAQRDAYPDVKALKIAANSNIALCYQKTNDHLEARRCCNDALKLDAKNVKALYRRGMCNFVLSDLREALADFQCVLELEPTNKAAINQINTCKRQLKEINDQEKKIYANMFTKLAVANKEPDLSDDSDVLNCGEWSEEEARREADKAFEQDNNIVMI